MSRNDSPPHSGVKVRTLSSIIDDLAKTSRRARGAAGAAGCRAAGRCSRAEFRRRQFGIFAQVSALSPRPPKPAHAAARGAGIGCRLRLRDRTEAAHRPGSSGSVSGRAGDRRKRTESRRAPSPPRRVLRHGGPRPAAGPASPFASARAAPVSPRRSRPSSADDPLRRGEWEATLPTSAPDLSLALPLLPAKLRAKLGRAALQPVFTADIHRLTRTVSLPSGTVEVSFDHGTLRAGDGPFPCARSSSS